MTERDPGNESANLSASQGTPAAAGADGGTCAAGAGQRQPLATQISESIAYMVESSNTEMKRGSDKTTAAVLPVACVLLIIAVLTLPQGSFELKAAAFCMPMVAFGYYIGSRIGIVRTMNTRQSYLTFHMLIATFLLGGTITLFILIVATMVMMANHVH